jgi:hypothetical protein
MCSHSSEKEAGLRSYARNDEPDNTFFNSLRTISGTARVGGLRVAASLICAK